MFLFNHKNQQVVRPAPTQISTNFEIGYKGNDTDATNNSKIMRMIKNQQVKRHIQNLCETVIKGNNTIIESVTIGPLLDKKSLNAVLEVIPILPNLQSLTLDVSVAVVPLSTLKGLVQCKSLTHLIIQNSWIQTNSEDETTRFDFSTLVPYFTNLKVLKFVSCGLVDNDIINMYKNLKSICLEELSVAGNDQLSQSGLSLLCLMNIDKLDLSNCDTNRSDLRAICGLARKEKICQVKRFFI